MSRITSFRDLTVWQEGMNLADDICVLTRRFPCDERFALTSDMRRAAISIPANVAEGNRRKRRARTATTCPSPSDRRQNWKRTSRSLCDRNA